ncbi:hypothetical protein GM3708_1196 [Geminocystis sp. NIES-3708]|nr:hypothetical protein GM3708_1196 [Geminocystis sp. NIES-3708]
MNFPDLVNNTRVKKYSFCCSGFTRIYMSRNTNITNFL